MKRRFKDFLTDRKTEPPRRSRGWTEPMFSVGQKIHLKGPGTAGVPAVIIGIQMERQGVAIVNSVFPDDRIIMPSFPEISYRVRILPWSEYPINQVFSERELEKWIWEE